MCGAALTGNQQTACSDRCRANLSRKTRAEDIQRTLWLLYARVSNAEGAPPETVKAWVLEWERGRQQKCDPLLD